MICAVLILLMIVGANSQCKDGSKNGCTSGKYCDTPGYITNKNAKCKDCPAGYKCPGGVNSKSKRKYKCPKGKYSKGKASKCTDCDKGHYQDKDGQSNCKKCDGNGHYQDKKGQRNCKSCGKGRYSIGKDNPLTGPTHLS